MVLLRKTPRSSTVIGLLVNDGTAGNKTDYVVTGMQQKIRNAGNKTDYVVTGMQQKIGNEQRCWRFSMQQMKKLQYILQN
jgi:hypothetical protein